MVKALFFSFLLFLGGLIFANFSFAASCPESNQICDTSTLRANPGDSCSTTGYSYASDTEAGRKFVIGCTDSSGNHGLCCEPNPKATPVPTLADCSGAGGSCTSRKCCAGFVPSKVCYGSRCDCTCGYASALSPQPTTNSTPIPPNPCPAQNGVCTHIPTALGNIDVTNPGAFIKTIFAVLLSLSGGVAMLLIIISGYRIMTAQGDPEKVKGAREMLTSAIIGLLFMIFSVSILQILGVEILHLPGFGK